jgi:hypothetical protein
MLMRTPDDDKGGTARLQAIRDRISNMTNTGQATRDDAAARMASAIKRGPKKMETSLLDVTFPVNPQFGSAERIKVWQRLPSQRCPTCTRFRLSILTR